MRSTYVPATTDRVRRHTRADINADIRRATIERLKLIGDDPILLVRRLREIEEEWDIERVLETNAASVILSGLLLGRLVHRRFYVMPAVVAAFLLQHAVQGWCPPVPFLRRMGVRTQREIDNERVVLLARLGALNEMKNEAPEDALRTLEH